MSCHPVGGQGKQKIGPNLADTTSRKSAGWMIEHFKRPAAMVPGSIMPPINLSDPQLSTLASFLLKLNETNAAALLAAPEFAAEGAILYHKHNCGACHVVNGAGVQAGPPLNSLRRRRTRSWIERHFVDPQRMSPGTIMPAYKFGPREMEHIVTYLLTLPD